MGKINWFPGHMAKAFGALNRIIKGVDLVLEVRDARIPLSSSNPKLDNLFKGKRHIVVLNKVDLVNKSSRQAALRHLKQQGLLALPASSSNPSSIRQLLKAAVGWIEADRSASELSIMLVAGLPNSGKSSLINSLKLAARTAGVLGGEQAYQRRAAVGASPGLTRQVCGFQVAAAPATYVLDSPGVMMPNIPCDDVGFRLALAGAIKDSIVGEEAIVRYLLHLLSTRHSPHLAALKASLLPSYRSPSSISGSSSSSAKWSGQGVAAKKQQERRVQQMRSALLDAAQYSEPRGLLIPAGMTHGVVDHDDALTWHPGDDDESYDVNNMRLELLHQRLGVAGGLNPSQQLGCHIRLLQAFRAGELGQYMLDEVQ